MNKWACNHHICQWANEQMSLWPPNMPMSKWTHEHVTTKKANKQTIKWTNEHVTTKYANEQMNKWGCNHQIWKWANEQMNKSKWACNHQMSALLVMIKDSPYSVRVIVDVFLIFFLCLIYLALSRTTFTQLYQTNLPYLVNSKISISI